MTFDEACRRIPNCDLQANRQGAKNAKETRIQHLTFEF
jgi:hypothetical protein